MGLDDLIPTTFRAQFSTRDADGNHIMPAIYKDHINAYGYGSKFIDDLRQQKGYTFAKVIEEPMNKAKYVQAQINEMCLHMQRNFR